MIWDFVCWYPFSISEIFDFGYFIGQVLSKILFHNKTKSFETTLKTLFLSLISASKLFIWAINNLFVLCFILLILILLHISTTQVYKYIKYCSRTYRVFSQDGKNMSSNTEYCYATKCNSPLGFMLFHYYYCTSSVSIFGHDLGDDLHFICLFWYSEE